jgi:hypothetical protein
VPLSANPSIWFKTLSIVTVERHPWPKVKKSVSLAREHKKRPNLA